MGMSFSSAGTGHRQPTRFPPGVSSMDAESEHILWTMRSPASVDRVITTIDIDDYTIVVKELPADDGFEYITLVRRSLITTLAAQGNQGDANGHPHIGQSSPARSRRALVASGCRHQRLPAVEEGQPATVSTSVLRLNPMSARPTSTPSALVGSFRHR